MEITPLAFDSLGTRSMATFVETKKLKVLIDPGVALGPNRYGLPPHEIELERCAQHWESIVEHATLADVLVVSHYHYDHHNPDSPEIYKGKVALLKHPKENINKSQTQRAAYFLDKLEGYPREIQYADGKEFTFDGVKIRFSSAVPHGNNAKLGYVVETLIDDGKETLVHTSDVEGVTLEEQQRFLLDEKPQVCFMDGPLTYMYGMPVDGVVRIVKEDFLEKLVVDHHFLRDINWREKLGPAFAIAKNTKIMTAAEFAGMENDLLEARRRELYGKK